MNITPTQHEKNEWSRMARAAYASGRNWTGHRYSAAASLPNGAKLQVCAFDTLQHNYRIWLINDEYPEPVPT